MYFDEGEGEDDRGIVSPKLSATTPRDRTKKPFGFGSAHDRGRREPSNGFDEECEDDRCEPRLKW